MPPIVDFNLCSGCATCEDSCPLDVIFFDCEAGRPQIRYPEECWHCGSCRQDCPVEAIRIRFPLRIMVPAGTNPY